MKSGTWLQPGELEACFWRSRGKTNRAAAVLMGVRAQTVDLQIAKAREKLGAHGFELDTLLVRGGELRRYNGPTQEEGARRVNGQRPDEAGR